MLIHIILSDLSYIWQTTTRQMKAKTISKKQRKEQHYQFNCEEKKRTKSSRKSWKIFPTNKQKKDELRKLIGTINLRHPRRNVAEQLHCSLHVKELKVTTTELEGQAGN